MDAKAILQRNASLKAAHQNGDYSLDALKGTLVGMGIGAGIGLIVGYQKKWSLLFCTLFGSIAGGVVSKAFVTVGSNKQKKSESAESAYETA